MTEADQAYYKQKLGLILCIKLENQRDTIEQELKEQLTKANPELKTQQESDSLTEFTYDFMSEILEHVYNYVVELQTEVLLQLQRDRKSLTELVEAARKKWLLKDVFSTREHSAKNVSIIFPQNDEEISLKNSSEYNNELNLADWSEYDD